MWCIGSLTAEYRERMHALCDLYGQAHNPAEPVVCVDEKSKQILRSSRPELPVRPGRCAKQDYEYVRGGTRNIFMAVEPLGGHREATVTPRRTKADFVHFICGLLSGTYQQVAKLHLVLDNINTHFRRSFEEVLGAQADAVLARVEFHHTPKHASWLNLAEQELGVMERRCAHGPTFRHRHRTRRRVARMAAKAQRRQGYAKMELHSRRRRQKTWPSLCNVTYGSLH